MKFIYAFENIGEYKKYQGITQEFQEKLKGYQLLLERDYSLTELPKGIVWTTEELATTVFSHVPLPAYANKDLIYMSPNLEGWRKLFVSQLEGRAIPAIQKYYENYSKNQLFTILAHELTHYSDLFLDDFEDARESGIWFEEGMCFYLPRKLLLSKKELEEITNIETQLVGAFQEKYGNHSLEDFGSSSYAGTLTSIMFDYWRSYLAVKQAIEGWAGGDIKLVFQEYRSWDEDGRKVPLSSRFRMDTLVEPF